MKQTSSPVKRLLRSFLCEESGQSLSEYALIISLVAIAAIGAVIGVSEAVKGIFSEDKDSIVNALSETT